MKDQTSKIIFAFGLIAIGVLGRFLPHLWNFTPIVAISLFAGVYLGKKYAVLVPLAAMLISDLFIGFYSAPIMISVYASFALVGLLGYFLRKHKSAETIIAASFISSTLFFLVTNWAVWQFGTMYSPSILGLWQSYLAGLPFYRNALLGDLFYTTSIFGAFEFARYLIAKKVLVISTLK